MLIAHSTFLESGCPEQSLVILYVQEIPVVMKLEGSSQTTQKPVIRLVLRKFYRVLNRRIFL
jgi:hypothetical protein